MSLRSREDAKIFLFQRTKVRDWPASRMGGKVEGENVSEKLTEEPKKRSKPGCGKGSM